MRGLFSTAIWREHSKSLSVALTGLGLILTFQNCSGFRGAVSADSASQNSLDYAAQAVHATSNEKQFRTALQEFGSIHNQDMMDLGLDTHQIGLLSGLPAVLKNESAAELSGDEGTIWDVLPSRTSVLTVATWSPTRIQTLRQDLRVSQGPAGSKQSWSPTANWSDESNMLYRLWVTEMFYGQMYSVFLETIILGENLQRFHKNIKLGAILANVTFSCNEIDSLGVDDTNLLASQVDLSSSGLAYLPQDVLAWLGSIQPSGLSVVEQWKIARDLGYGGAFGHGEHLAWLAADPQRTAQFNAAITQSANTLLSGGHTRAQQHQIALGLGYKGTFLCDTDICFRNGTCDAFGAAPWHINH